MIIAMKQKCNQRPDYSGWDKSDESNCKNVYIEAGYTKETPPIQTAGHGVRKRTIPVEIRVSMTLHNVVSIDEEDHSISLKFQICLEWKENRVTYRHLQRDWTINTVREEDVNRLWLPIVVYTNTDQHETTRLGERWEWSTIVHILREEGYARNDFKELDEAFVFQGGENSLKMEQIYTKTFQCIFQLTKYPFDTQVSVITSA